MATTIELKELLNKRDRGQTLAVFNFSEKDSDDAVLLKFQVWGRFTFPKFFPSEDAPFHREIDAYNLAIYRGTIRSFTNIAFRGAAKTTRTKLFFAYCIAHDTQHKRKYIRILSEDLGNSKQSVTDIYNLLIDPQVLWLCPEIFQKTPQKREETMASFTTATGIKVMSDSIGSDQRGQIQEASRPDINWFDDFETRNTLRSAVKTNSIWDNMEEARQGLAKDGGNIYTCNYLSERGNVHKLVEGANDANKVLKVGIIDENRNPTWPARYSKAECEQILEDADDPEGEYLQNPSASQDVLFDRDSVDNQITINPIKEIAGFKLYKTYDPSHRYALGSDIAGGVGLDSSTSVVIDFDTIPAQVVGTFHTNTIQPDVFGDELARQGTRFGECLLAPEKNNHGHATIGRLKQIYPLDKIHKTQRNEATVSQNQKATEYGWETNGLTKPKMMMALAKAIEDGHLALNDQDLKREARSYSRNDLMDREADVRLVTKHYDLLTACAIAWQMKDFAEVTDENEDENQEFVPERPRHASIGI